MAAGHARVTLSANEVLNLAAKAARGAGAPPAQAAAFGRAAVAFLLAGHDPADLSEALADLPGGPVIALPLEIHRIMETADAGQAAGPFSDQGYPRLAAAYIAVLPFEAHLDASCRLNMRLDRPANRHASGRIALSDARVAEWSAYAARLLVPETAASRQAGAGAGLTDND